MKSHCATQVILAVNCPQPQLPHNCPHTYLRSQKIFDRTNRCHHLMARPATRGRQATAAPVHHHQLVRHLSKHSLQQPSTRHCIDQVCKSNSWYLCVQTMVLLETASCTQRSQFDEDEANSSRISLALSGSNRTCMRGYYHRWHI